MSVIYELDSIPKDKALTISEDLTVTSIVDPSNKFQQAVCVHAFEVFQDKSGKEFLVLPFSYCYHHLENVPNVKKLNMAKYHEAISFTFQGALLPRQDLIKEQALEILQRTHSILLCLHTGFGKTIFTLYLLSKLGLRAVVLCHRSIIMQQWVESVNKYLPKASVGIFSPTAPEKTSTVDILICNVINVSKMGRNFYKPFGTVIVDEVHTVCTAQFSKALFSLTPSFLIGLSATPYRTDGMDRILELYVGPEMITKPMKRMFNAYRLATGFEPETEETVDGRLNWNAVLESQSSNEDRNKLICQLVWYFSNRNILVLVKRKEHALKLKAMLTKLGEDVDCFIHTAKSVNYSCRVLIATYSKGGVGFDHPKLDMLITGGDVEENFMQYLGRIFRRDDVVPIYVDLRDDMSAMVKHSQSRLRICKEVGGTVKDFEKVFSSFVVYKKFVKF